MSKIDPSQQNAFVLGYIPANGGEEQQALANLKEQVFMALKASGVLQQFNENSQTPGVRQHRVVYNPPALSAYINPNTPVKILLRQPSAEYPPLTRKQETEMSEEEIREYLKLMLEKDAPLEVTGRVQQMTLIADEPLPSCVYHVQVDNPELFHPETLLHIKQKFGISGGTPKDGSRRLYLLQVPPVCLQRMEGEAGE